MSLLGFDALGRLALGQLGGKLGPPVSGGAAKRLAQIQSQAIIAQPNPWTYTFMGGAQPYAPRRLVASITNVTPDTVPIAPGRASSLFHIVTMWQPDPWQYFGFGKSPYLLKTNTAGIPGQSINQPPYMLGGPVALKAEAVSIAQPNPWQYVYMGGAGPFMPRPVNAAIPGTSIDNPPFSFRGPLAIKLQQAAFSSPDWNGAAWPYLFAGRTQPYAPPMVIIGAMGPNDPPFGNRARTTTMQTLMRSWDAPPFYDFQAKLYASGTFPWRQRPTARGYIIL